MDEPTPRAAAQRLDLWEAYMHENRALRAEIAGLSDALAGAEQAGRTAERAEIAADLKARAEQQHADIEACKRDGGDWELVYIKALEADACCAIVRNRTKIEP